MSDNIKGLTALRASVDEKLEQIVNGMRAELQLISPANLGTRKGKLKALVDLYLIHLRQLRARYPSGSKEALDLEAEERRWGEFKTKTIDPLTIMQIDNFKITTGELLDQVERQLLFDRSVLRRDIQRLETLQLLKPIESLLSRITAANFGTKRRELEMVMNLFIIRLKELAQKFPSGSKSQKIVSAQLSTWTHYRDELNTLVSQNGVDTIKLDLVKGAIAGLADSIRTTHAGKVVFGPRRAAA